MQVHAAAIDTAVRTNTDIGNYKHFNKGNVNTAEPKTWLRKKFLCYFHRHWLDIAAKNELSPMHFCLCVGESDDNYVVACPALPRIF